MNENARNTCRTSQHDGLDRTFFRTRWRCGCEFDRTVREGYHDLEEFRPCEGHTVRPPFDNGF